MDNALSKHRTTRLRRQQPRRGAMLVLVAASLMIVLTIGAFCINVSFMQLTQTELRVATDAVARATAEALNREQDLNRAIRRGQELGAANVVANEPLLLNRRDMTFGRMAPAATHDDRFVFVPGATPPNAVKILGSRTDESETGAVRLLFGLMGKRAFEPTQARIASHLDVDIALAVDHSSTTGRKALRGQLQRSVDVLLGELRATQQLELVSLTGFANNARTRVELTDDVISVRQAVEDLYPWGLANIGEGIAQASDTLMDKTRSRPLAVKAIVVITSGDAVFDEHVVAAAQLAQQRGHVVHVLSLGEAANEALVQHVAELTGGQHHHLQDGAGLNEFVQRINTKLAHSVLELICCPSWAGSRLSRTLGHSP